MMTTESKPNEEKIKETTNQNYSITGWATTTFT